MIFSFTHIVRRTAVVVRLIATLGAVDVVAQTPRKMAYQVMALNPTTGQVLSNRDVEVHIELRRESSTGEAVWSQSFDARTDAAGVCDLTPSLSDCGL